MSEPQLSNPPTRDAYDVVVLGGAIAGASTALLLRREAPELSVLVVEKTKMFDAKVGEATTEMSGMFLTRRLALWHHLESEQLPKEGLRYWFQNEHVHSHADASEAGGYLRATVPSFQLRRDALDQHVLDLATEAGAELLRPAHAREVNLDPSPLENGRHSVRIDLGDGTSHLVSARWVVDASGRACVLGKRLGLIEPNEQHPTAAIWCRWRNVRHLDDVAAMGPLHFSRRNVSSRRLATNHYMGRGYWVWVIPLGNGETSIGIVYDRRLHRLHESRDRIPTYLKFLQDIPALAELLEGATPRTEDFRLYTHLAYATKQYMGDGWALVGDAAAFLDPYYSAGLDHMSFSVDATVDIVKRQCRGEDATEIKKRIALHNQIFVRSYWRFFAAAYKDKYFYMGECDLLSASFLLDTAQYYIFLVTPAYVRYGRFRSEPVLGTIHAGFNYRLMRLYNRRLKHIALARRAMGEEGRRNNGRRVKAFYNLGFAPVRMALRGVGLWLRAEIDLWRLHVKRLLAGKPASAFAEDPNESASASTPPPQRMQPSKHPTEPQAPGTRTMAAAGSTAPQP